MGTVTINLAGFAGNGMNGIPATEGTGKGKDGNGQVKNGAVFAGNINQMTNDRIEQRRAQARKQATQALMGQFQADSKVTDLMKELRVRNQEIDQEISTLTEQKKYYRAEQEALKDKYGISPDSEEQKQLDLIRKARQARKEGRLGELSKEELEQIANMDTSNLTEYQERFLQYDSVISTLFEEPLEELQNEKIGNGAVIRGLKQGLLETSYKGISKAYKAADSIMDAASKEIVGMAWAEAKEHLDEEMQELVEAAKEKAEEKEEEERKLEEAKAEKEEQKELTETIQEGMADQEKLQGEIDKILKEAELLQEEIKGLVVDDTV